jgi:hypothetical protein
MDNLYVILLIFATGIMTLTVERVMKVFFEKVRTPFPVIIVSYLLFWGALLLQLWLNNMALFVTIYLIALIIVPLNYESVLIKRVAAVAGSYLIIVSSGSIYLFLLYILPNDLFADYVDLSYVLAMILTYLMVLLTFPRFKNIRKTTINLHKLWLPFFFIPISQALFSVFYNLNIPAIFEIYSAVGPVGFTLIIFYLYNHLSKSFEDNVKSALHSQEKDYYFTQCQLMQESVENIKSIRHDMKFQLATVRDFIANNKLGEATDYLNSLLGDIEKNDIYSNTNNTAFDSIINFKLNNAKQENIKMNIRLLVPPALNIEVSDIVTIIGNLLDNALDAVAKVEEKIIKLDIEYSRESLFIQVENKYDGVIKYSMEKKKKEKRIITRKNGDENGHGLRNIMKSVDKYNGHIDISHEENIFSVGILLYVDVV